MTFQPIVRVTCCTLACVCLASLTLAGPISSPADIPGNVLWLDGDDVDGNGTSGGSFVGGTTWIDKSPDANQANMIISSGAPSPVVLGVPFSGRSSVQFNGSTDKMGNGSVSYTAKEVFVVFRVDSSRQSASDLGQLWGHYSTGTHVAVDARAGTNFKGFSFNGALTTTAEYSLDNNPFIGPFTDSNAQPWVYNAAHMISVIFSSDQSMTAQEISQLDSIAGHEFGGQIAEILVYDHELTNGTFSIYDNQLNDVQFYLQEKWGLSLGLSATPTLAPEPNSILLLGLGMLGLVARRRKRSAP